MSLRDLPALFGFGPGVNRTRMVLCNLGGLAVIFGGPLLALAAIPRYPWIVGNRFWWGCVAAIVAGGLLSLVIFRRRWPKSLPTAAKILASLGWSLGSVFLFFGVIAFANGRHSTPAVRNVPCVSKHHSRGRQIHYYLDVRAWPGSDETAIIDVPEAVYDAVQPPAVVQLRTERGWLGIEWLEGIGVVDMREIAAPGR